MRLTAGELAQLERLAGPTPLNVLIGAWIKSPPPPLPAPPPPAAPGPGLVWCGRRPRAAEPADKSLPLRVTPTEKARLKFVAESEAMSPSELLRAWIRGATAGRVEAEQLRADGADLRALVRTHKLGKYVLSLLPGMPEHRARRRRAKASPPPSAVPLPPLVGLPFASVIDRPNWTSSDPRQRDFFRDYLEERASNNR